MLFIRRVGTYPQEVQAHSVSTLARSCPEVEPTRLEQTEDQTKKTKPGILRRIINHPFIRPRSGLDCLKRIARGIIFGLTAVGTVPLAFGINEALAHLKIVPRPQNSSGLPKDSTSYGHEIISRFADDHEQINNPPSGNIITKIINSLINNSPPYNPSSSANFDNFVINHKGFEIILEAINKAKIDPKTLDTNDSGVIFDTVGDFEKLKSELKSLTNNPKEKVNNQIYEEAYAKLHEIEGLYCYLWGHEGPDPNKIPQMDAECSIVADVIGACLTPKNVQRYLKPYIQVTDFNLSENKEDFYINLKININGQTLRVHYGDLKNWSKYDCRELPIGPCAFIYAIQKELERDYIPTPYAPLSAPSILLTREKYYIIPTILLSDSTLEDIFSDAPNSIIKLGSYPLVDNYLDHYARYLHLQTGAAPSEGKFADSEVYETHAYVVKNIKYEKGDFKVVVKDGESEKELTRSQIRDTMLYVALPSSKLRFLDERTRILWSLALILSYALTKGINAVDKKRAPKHEAVV